MAAAARPGEAGQQGAGKGSGVEAARLRVAERVLEEGGRGGCAQQRVGVCEGRVEAEQGGEGLTPAVGCPDGLTAEGCLLDSSGQRLP